jgi:hypothetical protein
MLIINSLMLTVEMLIFTIDSPMCTIDRIMLTTRLSPEHEINNNIEYKTVNEINIIIKKLVTLNRS